MDREHLQKTTHQHDQTSSILEPTRKRETRKTQEQLEKVCGGRTYTEKIYKRNMQQFQWFYWVTVHIRKSFNWNILIRPYSMDFTWLGIQIYICWSQIPYKKVGRGSGNQSVFVVTTICLMQRGTSPSHRVDQAVNCGLWNVVPLPFNGYAKLLDIGRNWNTLSYKSIQSIPNMLDG